MIESLNIDLNEFVNEQIQQEMSSLKKKIDELVLANKSLIVENSILKTEISSNKISTKISNDIEDLIKKGFVNCDGMKPTGNSKQLSPQCLQYLYFERFLSLFGIKPEQGGWKEYGSLFNNLAVNYYGNKDAVILLLKLLIPDSKGIKIIEDFKMPYDYTEEQILKFVKNPKYNTNGEMYGVSKYWVEDGANDKVNVPHDLLLSNPNILKENVFDELINTIKFKRGEYHYLFALPTYNHSVSEEQIVRLGECLIGLASNTFTFSYSHIKIFISKHISKFNEKTLEYLYKFIISDNSYQTLYWANFPYEYQIRFLKEKPINDTLKLLVNCNWSTEDINTFLSEKYGK